MSQARDIAILGATGFVGQALARNLRNRPDVGRVLGFGSSDFDLRRPETWGEKLRGIGCVINAAAKIDGDTYEVFSTNTVNVRGLAIYLNELGTAKLINLSTGAVYGPHDGPTRPSLHCAPQGDYSVSKYVGERLLQENFEGHLNTLRLYYPYGPGQKKPRLLPRLTWTISRGKTVTCDERGGPFLSMTHVDDVADVIVRDFVLMDWREPITNLASSAVVSVSSIAQAIAAELGVRAEIRFEGRASDVLSEPYQGYEWRPFEVNQELVRSFAI